MNKEEFDKRNLELANLHTTMSPEQVQFIKDRGFEVVHGIPYNEGKRDRMYIQLMTDQPTGVITGKYSRSITLGIFRPGPTPTDALTGMVEEMLVEIHDLTTRFGEMYYPCPKKEKVRIYIDSPDWDTPLDKLLERYAKN